MKLNEHIRASVITDYKLAKYWGGGERRGKRGETGYKLIAGLGISKKFCER